MSDSKQAEKTYLSRTGGRAWEREKPFPPVGSELFYVMTAGQTPNGIAPGVTTLSSRLAVDVRDGLSEVGLSPSSHLGENGLWTTRTALAGLSRVDAGTMTCATPPMPG